MAGLRKFFTFRHLERAPRVLVIPLHEINFEGKDANFKTAKIHDISTTGMAIDRQSIDKTPYIGQIVEGTIQTPDDEQDIELEVRHCSGGKIGLMVIGNYKGYSQLVETYLQTEIEAVKLNELPQDKVIPHPNGITRVWETDDPRNGCSLYLVTNKDGDVILFELSFFGNIIAGGRNGNILSPVKRRIAKTAGTPRVLTPGLRDSLIKFLASIQGLPKNAFEQIEFILYHKTLAA